MENSNEIWQTSVNGQIYETDFSGLIEWINEGSLLPQDKVRKGNLRWIEANKVPTLHQFFNAKQSESANQVVTSTNIQNSPPQVQNFNAHQPQIAAQNFQTPPPPNFYEELTPEAEKKFCVIHNDAKAKYFCEVCGNNFCKACPQKGVCLMCGANCKTINTPLMPNPPVAQPFPQPAGNQEAFIDEDVRKSASWFYWKAGATMVNAVLIVAGVYWQFYLGLTLPQFVHGFMIGFTDMAIEDGLKSFHAPVMLVALVGSALTGFIGYQAKQAKKWAFVVGILIFVFDTLLCLVTFSIIGVALHLFAIYSLSKGYSGCKKH